LLLLLPGTAVAVAVADTAVAAAIFLVMPSLWIGNRDRDRVRDNVDLAAAFDFSAAPCFLLLIRFDSIRFTLRRYY